MNASDLDDLSPTIGYRATRILQGWFAGSRLHVPSRASPGHFLGRLIGRPAFEKLCDEFGGDRVYIPTHQQDDTHRRYRRIADLFAMGTTAHHVAAAVGLDVRRVRQIRAELAEIGVLEYAGGFDTAMAVQRRRRVGELPKLAEIFKSGEVSAEPPPPSRVARGPFVGLGD